MKEGLFRAWEWVLDLIYPPRDSEGEWIPIHPPFCSFCGHPVHGRVEGAWRCSNCRGQRWYLDEARAGFLMQGGLREAIHGFKYRGEFDRLLKLREGLVESYFREAGEKDWEGLVPVPLPRLRRWARGFNQAEELAKALATRAGIAVIPALYRCRETPRQALLRRSARLRNLREAFAVRNPAWVTGKKLLLIDDVLTTGATANACARALKKAGAIRVGVLTLARG